ncbi:MAG: ferredoxin [Candidatus Aenigmarchaeota archaeon]|nr:ferredoxin [Candidatus Aenigmarchaeota archaeon]
MAKVRYRIEYERKGCIGAGVCAALAPERWEMNQDGKADLVDGTPMTGNEGWFVLEIEEEEFEPNKMSAEGCPAVVIHIYRLNEDGTEEKII